MQRRAFLKFFGATAVLSILGRPARALDAQDFALDASGSDFSWTTAAFAWEFSQIAYRNPKEIDRGKLTSLRIPGEQLSSYPGPAGLALHDTQVLAWQRNQYSVIAYRGTEGTKALNGIQQGEYGKEVLDVLTGARFFQKKLANAEGDVRVHSGLFEAVEETWPFVQAILDTRKPVVFVGHSLGGGLATYAAYKAQMTGSNVASVWTFGSPRVGNPGFANAYNEVLGSLTYRFANELDVMTRLPVRGFFGIPFLPEYRHVGQPIVLWSDGHVDSGWAEMMRTIRIDDRLISAFSEDLSFAPHLLYEPAVYGNDAPNFVAALETEEAPKGLFLKLLLDLSILEGLTNGETLDAIRTKWRLD